MRPILTLYKGNTMMLQLVGKPGSPGLSDHRGEAVDDAAVVAVLRRDGEELVSVTLAHVAGTEGDYEGAIAGDLAVEVGEVLEGELVAVRGVSRLQMALEVRVRERA